ncbi:MAG: DNA polymerase 1 [Candidatus Heimdallarchaeota archaeon LC_2]|nr:MAG: DNA polymerase 1 [Candidatus Heimdallarchaeota archaeon LC_2]
MDLEDFFEVTSTKEMGDAQSTEKQPVEDREEEIKEEKLNDTQNHERIERIGDKFEPEIFELGQDIEDILLLDVIYEPVSSKAQCIFYHEPSKSIYKWTDTTGHQPYLLTHLTEEGIKKIDKIVKSSEYVKTETVKRFDLLGEKEINITKLYGTNPLAIGGRPNSFRELIDPTFESDIRYHFSYVTDNKLTPGTYYKVVRGNLEPSGGDIDKEVEKELTEAFQGEKKEQLQMLDEYMPLLFQKIPDVLRCAFDIEIGSPKGIMPNPNKPVEEIISISLVDSEGRKICWVLNRPEVDQEVDFDDIIVKRYDNEISLLEDFFDIIDVYPIAISFNGDNFDMPYIFNRAIRLGIDRADIPIKMKRNDVAFSSSVHLDLYRFFRQAAIRIYAFGGKYDNTSLNELSVALLNENKLEHPDVWINEMDLATLVKYNVIDAELTLKLTQFDDNVVLNLMFILMRICKMPLFDFSRIAVSGWLQLWLIYEHRKRNYLVPRKDDILLAKGESATSSAIIEGKKFQGAIVLDPKPGVWWNVRVLDFASLYPSIIKNRNLSYETIRCNHEECKTNIVPEVNHWACTKRLGIFSIVLGFIRDTRVNWFKPRSSDNNLNEKERRINQVIQSSLKVLINAGYGVFGSTTFDFYCPPVAESTTAYARDAIRKTQDYSENTLGVPVLYGDTDSVFLYQITDEQTERLIAWGIEHIGVELGTDYIFRYVIFSDRKKNYVGVTTNNKTIVKGLMGKKKNTPKIIRDNFSRTLEILKTVYSNDELEHAKERIIELLQAMIYKLESGNFTVDDASIRLTISKRVKEYGTWTQTMQVIAQIYDNIIKEKEKKGEKEEISDSERIGIGDQVKFVKIAKPVRVNVQKKFGFAFPPGVKEVTVKPVELMTDDDIIDGKPLIDSAEATFSQFLSSIGVSWERIMGIQSLDDDWY